MSGRQKPRYVANYFITFVLAATLSFGVTTPALAGSGTSAGDILNIPIYSRGAALSGAGVAIASGTGALYYNPAGLGSGPTEITFTHSELLQDLQLNNVSASWLVGTHTGIGVGITYLGYGTIDGYSASAEPTGEVSAYSAVATIGISRRISPGLSLGFTAKPVFERLDQFTAKTVTFDFGLLAHTGPVAFGAGYSNLGGSLKFLSDSAELPGVLRAGIAYSSRLTGYTVSVAAARRAGNLVDLNGGVEYAYNSMITLRIGYGSALGDHSSSLEGFAGGIGLKIQQLGLDYSYRPADTDEGIHQFTASYFLSP